LPLSSLPLIKLPHALVDFAARRFRAQCQSSATTDWQVKKDPTVEFVSPDERPPLRFTFVCAHRTRFGTEKGARSAAYSTVTCCSRAAVDSRPFEFLLGLQANSQDQVSPDGILRRGTSSGTWFGLSVSVRGRSPVTCCWTLMRLGTRSDTVVCIYGNRNTCDESTFVFGAF
jgi:hypothetical protein